MKLVVSLEDYVKINQDYSKLDDNFLLNEYYRQTKPHLTSDEINFLMEDSFSFDEEIDDQEILKERNWHLKSKLQMLKST